MNNILKKIVYSIIALIQICLVIGIFAIEYLTKKKAGVMHHVYYMKYQYEQTIFTPDKLHIYKYASIVLLFIFVVLFFVVIKKASNFYKTQLFILCLLDLFSFMVLGTPLFEKMLSYPYLIMATVIDIGIQLIMVIIASFTKNVKK